jgi:hypothetical protein
MTGNASSTAPLQALGSEAVEGATTVRLSIGPGGGPGRWHGRGLAHYGQSIRL